MDRPFGQAAKDGGLKEVYRVKVMPVSGGEPVSIEVYAVPTINQIKNEHVEVRKKEYPNLKGLCFRMCAEIGFEDRSFDRCRLPADVPRYGMIW